MKFLRNLCIAVYCIVVFLAGAAFFSEGICENAISQAVLRNVVTDNLLTIYDKLDAFLSDDQLEALKEDAQGYTTDENLNQTIQLYIQAVKDTVSELPGTDTSGLTTDAVKAHLDSDQVTDNINTFGNDVIDKMSTVVKANLDSDMSSVRKQLLESAINSVFSDMKPTVTEGITTFADTGLDQVLAKITPQMILVIKIYMALCSTVMRVILVIVGMILIAATIFLNRFKRNALTQIGVATEIAGALWLIISFFANTVIQKVLNGISGLEDYSIQMDMTPLKQYGIVLIIIGLILCIIRIRMKKSTTDSRNRIE